MKPQVVPPTNKFAELLGVKTGNVPISDVVDALRRKGAAIKRIAHQPKRRIRR